MASTAMPPPPASAAEPALASKKKEHLAAGRRKLEEYRKRKAEEKKIGERQKTDGPISGNAVLNVQLEERTLDRTKSSSVYINKSVFVNGPESNIIGESAVKACSLADQLNAGLNQFPESELHKEESNGKLPRRVESDKEEAGNNSEETTGHLNGKDNSVWRDSSNDWPASDGSKVGFSFESAAYQAQQQDLTGVECEGSIFNEEGGNHMKRPLGDSSGGSSMKPSYNSSTAFPIPKQQSAGTSMGVPDWSFTHTQKNDGPFSFTPVRGKIGRAVSDFQLDSYAKANDMIPGAIDPSADGLLPFLPSTAHSTFNSKETKPNISFKPSDNLYFGTPTTSLALPMDESSIDATVLTHSTATGTSARNVLLPSVSDMPLTARSEGVTVTGHGMGFPNRSDEIQRHSERDEFAALEQHIEDLTQEKFSLQRALDAARSLAESLAQENSALTEDYNSQGIAINQLHADLERQADEFKKQSLVLSSLMLEREKAQQESNSALERSQILAGEVIGLEEKVLKLRSNELKLERDLEGLKSENDSYRGQLAILDKDRQNLRSMIEALQEEKKLLQGHLRKNLGSKDPQVSKTKGVVSRELRNVSTSTDDLGHWEATTCIEQEQGPLKGIETSNELSETTDTRFDAASSSSSTLPPNPLDLNASPAVAMLPVDHFKMVNNIDLLITELAAEKESFLKALKRESKKASELETLNAELSKKLEVQTQRLELVFAQNMAHGGTTTITNDVHQGNEFVDEGDEVVERVLGWIMRLFPSGSSKRRTSKLL